MDNKCFAIKWGEFESALNLTPNPNCRSGTDAGTRAIAQEIEALSCMDNLPLLTKLDLCVFWSELMHSEACAEPYRTLKAELRKSSATDKDIEAYIGPRFKTSRGVISRHRIVMTCGYDDIIKDYRSGVISNSVAAEEVRSKVYITSALKTQSQVSREDTDLNAKITAAEDLALSQVLPKGSAYSTAEDVMALLNVSGLGFMVRSALGVRLYDLMTPEKCQELGMKQMSMGYIRKTYGVNEWIQEFYRKLVYHIVEDGVQDILVSMFKGELSHNEAYAKVMKGKIMTCKCGFVGDAAKDFSPFRSCKTCRNKTRKDKSNGKKVDGLSDSQQNSQEVVQEVVQDAQANTQSLVRKKNTVKRKRISDELSRSIEKTMRDMTERGKTDSFGSAMNVVGNLNHYITMFLRDITPHYAALQPKDKAKVKRAANQQLNRLTEELSKF